MRADARRNHAAVLDAGVRLLSERPAASMQEIAEASGVGRTTVYRHFPAREDLIAALITQVVDEVVAANAVALSSDRPAAEALRRLAADITVLGRRWAFLHAHREDVVARTGESDRRFVQWATAAQRRGELRDDLSPDWILTATRGILTAAAEKSEALGVKEAGRLAGETLVSAFVRHR